MIFADFCVGNNTFSRLTPVYMIVLMVVANILPHLTNGQFELLNIFTDASSACSSSWWHNLLFINNFYNDVGHVSFISYRIGCLKVVTLFQWNNVNALQLQNTQLIALRSYQYTVRDCEILASVLLTLINEL